MAYTATVSLDIPKAERVSRRNAILRGVITLSAYHATLAEITDITGKFKSAPRVVCEGTSSNGYVVRWDTTSKAVKAYYPRPAQSAATTAGNVATTTISSALGDGDAGIFNVTIPSGFRSAVDASAGGEVANDTNVGTIAFIATGRI